MEFRKKIPRNNYPRLFTNNLIFFCFKVYVAEMDDDVAACTKRNIHKRTEKEIQDLANAWEKTPSHYIRLDVRSLLQAAAITEVEMEVVSDTEMEKSDGEEQKDGEKKEDEEEVSVIWESIQSKA